MVLARLLENPRCKLRRVFLGETQINDDYMFVLAKAFKKNRPVKTLVLGRTGLFQRLCGAPNPITARG